MRLLLGAGVLLGLAATACKDTLTPVDFTDPVALSANLTAVDSAVKIDVFRSFGTATLSLGVAKAPPIGPAASLLATLEPQLQRSGSRMLLPGLRQAGQLQAALPKLSVAAAQGRIIPDSLYGRVFEWDTTTHQYTWQGKTVTGLSGVRFELYAVGLDDQIVEPVTVIGQLDILDQSTPTILQLQVLVDGPGGAPTYVDYTVSLQVNGPTTATASASGYITNAEPIPSNKTLTFDETLTIHQGSASAHANYALNNPAITLIVQESVGFTNPDLVIDADFQLVQAGQETIEIRGHFADNTITNAVTVTVTVYQGGHPVASFNGDPQNVATLWKDAGGKPLSADDLAALDHLFDAFERLQTAVQELFSPVTAFATL